MLDYKLLSILDAIYIVYMLNFFKTKYSVAHPLTYFENKLLYHPIGISKDPVNNVCPLGNYLSFFLAIFILIRCYLHNTNYQIKRNISLFILAITIIMSLLNFNVVLYLLPHYFIDYYLINKYSTNI